jgi:hypothetical protein
MLWPSLLVSIAYRGLISRICVRANVMAGMIPDTGLARNVTFERPEGTLKDAKSVEEGRF